MLFNIFTTMLSQEPFSKQTPTSIRKQFFKGILDPLSWIQVSSNVCVSLGLTHNRKYRPSQLSSFKNFTVGLKKKQFFVPNQSPRRGSLLCSVKKNVDMHLKHSTKKLYCTNYLFNEHLNALKFFLDFKILDRESIKKIGKPNLNEKQTWLATRTKNNMFKTLSSVG